MSNDKVTADIPTEQEAFRRHTIEAFRLIHINLRELASRFDDMDRQLTALQRAEYGSAGVVAFKRVERLEGDVARLQVRKKK